jgi:hypothetical protein
MLLVSTALLAATTPVLAAGPAPHDYFFGDSDLEQGNFQIIAKQGAADRAPYYCASGLCRDSNGPVWPELIHPGVHVDLAASPGDPALNFAVSGAHMTERGDPDLPVPTGVVAQVARFAALQDEGLLTVRPEDRFFIHAGTNDLIRLIDGDDGDTVKADIVEAATANIATLAARGAKTIVIADVQPVQYLPLLAGTELQGFRGAVGNFIAERKVMGSWNGSTLPRVHIPLWIALYQQGRLKLDELVSGRYPLGQINEAIAQMEGGGALRNVIVF